jgi:hypothetical protein
MKCRFPCLTVNSSADDVFPSDGINAVKWKLQSVTKVSAKNAFLQILFVSFGR